MTEEVCVHATGATWAAAGLVRRQREGKRGCDSPWLPGKGRARQGQQV